MRITELKRQTKSNKMEEGRAGEVMRRGQKQIRESVTEYSPRIDYNHGSWPGPVLVVKSDPPPAVTDFVGKLKKTIKS